MEVSPRQVQVVRTGEEAMARRIGLAYQVSQPLSVAGALIPGKFIYDAVMRHREVTWARDRFLPPRLEALEVAARRLREEDEGATEPEARRDARERLVVRLAAHYVRLLRADGRRYEDLLRQAWPNPVELEAEWDAIEALETELDEVARQMRPADAKLAARLEAYRECAHHQRRRVVHELYYE